MLEICSKETVRNPRAVDDVGSLKLLDNRGVFNLILVRVRGKEGKTRERGVRVQVHAARLHSGELVVVKVQRPGLRALFDIDLANLKVRRSLWCRAWWCALI